MAVMKVLLIILVCLLSCISCEENSDCECGAFKTEAIAGAEDPIITRVAPRKVACNAVGQAACNKTCFIMGKAEKSNGPKLVCTVLKTTVKDLKPAIFAKVCGGKWIYTGLTSSSAICCSSGKPTLCS